MAEQVDEMTEESTNDPASINKRIRLIAGFVITIVVTFFLGFGGGYLKWGQDEMGELKQQKEMSELYEQINPTDGYTLPVSYEDLGPQLMAAGVIDYDAFMSVMTAGGDALSDHQVDILKKGSKEQIVINAENAHFLLNFFWAAEYSSGSGFAAIHQTLQTSGLLPQAPTQGGSCAN